MKDLIKVCTETPLSKTALQIWRQQLTTQATKAIIGEIAREIHDKKDALWKTDTTTPAGHFKLVGLQGHLKGLERALIILTMEETEDGNTK